MSTRLVSELMTGRAPGHPGESAARISTVAGSAVGRGGVRALRLPQGAVKEVASCSDLAVLFEQNHCPVVDLKLTVVLQTSHLEGEMTSSPGDRRTKKRAVAPSVQRPLGQIRGRS